MGQCGSHQMRYSEQITKSDDPNETGIFRHPSSLDTLPVGYMASCGNIFNLQQGFKHSARIFANRPCLGSRANLSRSGEYVSKTYAQVETIVKEIGAGMTHMGLFNQENGVKLIAIYGKNCEEWLMTDVAANCWGITSVAIYDTLGAESMAFILDQTQVNTIFITTAMAGPLAKHGKMANVKNIVYFEQQEPLQQEDREALVRLNYQVIGMNQVRQAGREHPQDYPQISDDTLSTISYTSGTTGNPKGVMLSHSNMASVMGAMQNSEVRFHDDDVHLSYLPLAHVFERCMSYASLVQGVYIGYFQGDVMKLKEDLADLRPTVFASVPRLYNRFHDLMQAQFSSLTGAKASLVKTALSSKISNLRNDASVTHSIYDRLVFNKTKAVFGGRVRVMVTASAPIQGDVLDFLKVATICPIIEGYGQTESGGASYLTSMRDPQSGHVGGPAVNVEMKIQGVPDMEYLVTDCNQDGELTPRGELLIRGTGIFQGYYKDPAKTAEAKNKDGWLHTGDVVRLNPNGSINIIDRKKNIFKLAQGEYVAAEKLEIGYRVMSEIEEIFVYGDSLQAYLVAVVFPNEPALKALAQQNNIQDDSYEALLNNPEIKKALLAKIAAKAKEVKFNGIEVPKKLHLIPKSFADYNCLTTSFKLQRHQAKKTFLAEIQQMYSS